MGNKMENNINHMEYEWSKERELYTPEMWDKFYEQKVDMVIGGIDIAQLKSIHRPLMNIDAVQAREIADRVRNELFMKGYICEVDYSMGEHEDFYRINVTYLGNAKHDNLNNFNLRDLKLVKKNKFLHNYEATYVNGKGHIKLYELISRKVNLNKNTFGSTDRFNTDAVGIAVFNKSRDRILLQKEFRMACGEWVYNLPGGLVDEGETIEEAARRELREETGVNLTSIIKILAPAYTAVGLSNESVSTVIGVGTGETSTSTSEDEVIEADWYSKADVMRLISNKEPMSLRTQSFLYMWVTSGLNYV